jgi:hypothetical protein
MSDAWPPQKGIKQGDAISPLYFNFALEYSFGNVEENAGVGTEWATSATGLR